MHARTLPVAATLALVASLAACGGQDAPASTDTSTPQGLAQTIGCTGYTADTTEELYVREVGTCTLGGEKLRLLTFNDERGRQGFVDTAKTFGGVYVSGGTWAVETDSTATAEQVRGKAGGEL